MTSLREITLSLLTNQSVEAAELELARLLDQERQQQRLEDASVVERYRAGLALQRQAPPKVLQVLQEAADRIRYRKTREPRRLDTP